MKLEDAIREMRNGKIAEQAGVNYRIRDGRLEMAYDGNDWSSPPEVKLATAIADEWSIVRETFDVHEAIRRALAGKIVRREERNGKLRLGVDHAGDFCWITSDGSYCGQFGFLGDMTATDYYEDEVPA